MFAIKAGMGTVSLRGSTHSYRSGQGYKGTKVKKEQIFYFYQSDESGKNFVPFALLSLCILVLTGNFSILFLTRHYVHTIFLTAY